MTILLLAWIFVCPLDGHSKPQLQQRRRFNLVAGMSHNTSFIQTKKSATTSSAKTSSTFEAFGIGGDYFVSDHVALTGQMLLSFISSADAGIKGYDLGLRYYFLKSGHESEATILGTTIESTPGWTPFLHAAFAGRDYQFSTTSISFQGLEAGGGIDFHYKQHSFIRGSFDYLSLQNTSTRNFTGFSAGISLGFSF
jgi:hypothetical protein